MSGLVSGVFKFIGDAIKYISVNFAWDKSAKAVDNHGDSYLSERTKFYLEAIFLSIAVYVIWESVLEPQLERHHKHAITEAITDPNTQLAQHAVFPPKQVVDHCDRLRSQQNCGYTTFQRQGTSSTQSE